MMESSFYNNGDDVPARSEDLFSHLPAEIIEIILKERSVGIPEFNSLLRTCHTFNNIISTSPELWRVKFNQTWQAYDYLKSCHASGAPFWRDVTRLRRQASQCVLAKLHVLAEQSFSGMDEKIQAESEAKLYNFLDPECFPLLQENPNVNKFRFSFVLDELADIVTRDSATLTQKYFAKKSLRYLRHIALEEEANNVSESFLNDMDNNLLLDRSLVLIAQWFQPLEQITQDEIMAGYDRLAGKVRDCLRESHPHHSLFTDHHTEFCSLDLRESMWTPEECSQVILAIETVCKPILNKDFSQYYVPENSYMNCVLNTLKGIPIMLCVLVRTIGLKLGLVLEPVNFPQHFLLRWPQYAGTRSGLKQYTFVDPFRMNYHIKAEDIVTVPETMAHHCKKCSNRDIVKRMLRNLLNLAENHMHDRYSSLPFMRQIVDLHSILFPEDDQIRIFFYVNLRLHLRVDLLSAISVLQESRSQRPGEDEHISDLQTPCETTLAMMSAQQLEEKKPKLRADHPQVKYSVGLVMQHRKYRYFCVIVGWDPKCKASKRWQNQMGITSEQAKLPFYNVMVMDASDRYACEDNLVYTRDTKEITHPEVDRMFDHFCNQRYYAANEWLQREYPDDLSATSRVMAEDNFSQLEVLQ